MAKVISKSNFNFYEIAEQYKENFKEQSWHDLSEFHAEALTWVGDAIRQAKSQFFWCNGCYCWYTDETQSHEQCVWQTVNGILMFEDVTDKKLYRVEFVR